MNTDIRYLEILRGDLEEAARREAERGLRAPNAGGRMFRLARPLGVAVAATLVVAGLIGWFATNGGFSADDSGGAGGYAAAETGAMASTGATGATGGADPAATPGLGYNEQEGSGDTPPGASIRVIRTAEIGLQIPRNAFDEVFGDAADVASDHDGFVQDSTTRERSGELTMRVPAASFGETLEDLRDLGEVQLQRIEGRDVTAEYVDLRARLRIVKARREVLLRLMDEATTIEQTIRVLNALDETQLRIEQIQGELNLLDDRTSLATIRVSLQEEGAQPEEDVERASLPNAVERSIAGFVGVIAAIVVGLGYLIPLMVISLAAWFVWSRIQRRGGA